MKKLILLFGALLFYGHIVHAQDIQNHDIGDDTLRSATSDIGLFPKSEDDELYRIRVDGYYRFFATYTHMKEPYLLNQGTKYYTPKNWLFIGDDSQLPNLMLNVTGRPSSKTAWGIDLYMFQFLDGQIKPAYSVQIADSLRPTIYDPISGTRLAIHLGLHLGINLYGTFNTDFGTFNVKFGGIQWVSMSDLTLASFKGYNRFTLFERNPWDPLEKKSIDRYDNFFSRGNIDQDKRWGEKAFQGFNLEGLGLPGNISFKVLLGKTELNGGFLAIPNFSYGGQVRKNFADGSFVGVNTFNGHTYTDSLNTANIDFNVITGEMTVHFDNWLIYAEIGAGKYKAPSYRGGWGEAINLKVRTPQLLTRLILELQYYRLSPEIINNSAIFLNTSVVEEQNNEIPPGSVGSSAVLQPFASSMVPLGMMTNNRQGFVLNAELPFNRLKLSLAIGASGELEPFSNQITYDHPVNLLTRSRFWRWTFPTNVGPYDRYSVIYRDVYETVNLTDDSLGIVVNPKRFSGLEIQGRYNTKLFSRDLYLFLLNRYYSAQNFWSPVTVFSEKAYIRHYSNQLEGYYQIAKGIILAGYLGYERIICNYDTEADLESRRPRNQEGTGYGLGLDITLSKNVVLFLRHRWFAFEDRSFALDKFKGSETIVELKIVF